MIERVTQLVAENKSAVTSGSMNLFMGHGSGDPQIKRQWAERSQQALKSMGFENVVFRIYS